MISNTPCSRAPVALFAYNRPDHTRRTLAALQANTLAAETSLYIFVDAPRDETEHAANAAVLECVRDVQGFASVTLILRERNLGLAASIIDGVTQLCERYGRVIVLEDDLLTSRYFLSFMNEGLNRYEPNPAVHSISGYMYPVDLDRSASSFFLTLPNPWGWATWKDRWRAFEHDGKILLHQIVAAGRQRAFDSNGPHSYLNMLRGQIAGRNHSWFIRWHACGFLKDGLTLYPSRSLVRNIGIDGSGVHCADWRIDPFAVEVATSAVPIANGLIVPHTANQTLLNRYFLRIRVARYVNFAYRQLRRLWPNRSA